MRKRTINLLIALVMTIMVFSPMTAIAETTELTTTQAPLENAATEKEWVTKGWNRLYKDEAFQAERFITRGEFLALINSLFEFKDQKEISFTDVPQESLYFKEVAKAINAGYIQGNGDSTFKPEREVTNIEAYIMISRILNLDITKQPEKMLQFKDSNEVPQWAFGQVEAYVQKGFLEGKNKIKPFEKILGIDAVMLLEIAAATKESAIVETPAVEEEVKGNGNNPLNFLGAYFVSVDGTQSVELGKLEDGNTTDEIIIKLVFDRGVVRDNWENNKSQIKLQSNKGDEIAGEVFRIEGVDTEKEFIFVKLLEEIKSGKTVNIVIGADLKANNGNSLGTEQTLSFVVK